MATDPIQAHLIMPDKPTDGKLSPVEKLKLKRDQIEARIKQAQARESQQARKDDTRRKVIAGALALEHTEKNPTSEFARKLTSLLEEYARPEDRRLFTHLGLKPAAKIKRAPANDQPGLKSQFEATKE